MAFKMVDTPKNLEGFAYIASNGIEETVSLPDGDGVVTIILDGGSKCFAFKDDIPNLIKALQAAYDYTESV